VDLHGVSVASWGRGRIPDGRVKGARDGTAYPDPVDARVLPGGRRPAARPARARGLRPRRRGGARNANIFVDDSATSAGGAWRPPVRPPLPQPHRPLGGVLVGTLPGSDRHGLGHLGR
jgi:hypothetical protein